MSAPRPPRPIDDHCEHLPESCRQRWAELLAERRTARAEDDREEAARLLGFGLGFVKALYLTGQINITARDDLQAALIAA
ncbi:hypothetical protein A7X76_06700 [Stenotrophomonas maltophilia]|uniref:hypothetical protein n=1 Tax=Stenotrophomonas maltophilia TaxID=40324 RepID=UPI000DAA3028|nr:hypothetical protein [Stenotrophomonas maltophilia]PZS72514.1 hypothetical protein A7X76_06700 [Stenotrophomonas maltophilia]HEL2983840.1 hypothetical protein [Stenotrophomonas maltophilia]